MPEKEINSWEWTNHEIDLSKLQQEVNKSLEQHIDNEEIVRELEQIKSTLENNSLDDQQKRAEIQNELQSLKEKGIILTNLQELEAKIDALDQLEKNSSATIMPSKGQLQEIASLSSQPERDQRISQLADIGRGVSEQQVTQTINSMKQQRGIRGAIGRFFGNKI